MKEAIVPYELVQQKLKECEMEQLGKASIREVVKLVNEIELVSDVKFLRMSMGVPGLTPPKIATEAEIKALRKGVVSQYPAIEGLPELKTQASRFLKMFLDIDVSPEGCVPTCGSMQGSFAVFITVNRTDRNKEGTLFLDPGFPVQKQQCNVVGHDFEAFDIYKFRGNKLKDKIESYLKTYKISSILYSNPNNPSWICLTEDELSVIGELATKYDVIVVEDLAYFGMDFRKDISKPGQPPFQPTVAKYTDNYILLISTSKAFSYAGQRIALMVMSDKIFKRHYPDLKRYYNSDILGRAMIYGALFSLSAGAPHSSQLGIASILKAANDGKYDLVKEIREYENRSKIIKKLFIDNGFKIVYDRDIEEPIADGFYFTVSYPGFSGNELVERLFYYGISTVSLDNTGSEYKEGIRICVSQMKQDLLPVLEQRLIAFRNNNT
ncbi:MAG: pyridoxal phosphate-dependent aminotransferase [Bacteroidales bacterium]|nr:MAG: pyridoxal phosphate-dependent aminotransferase [Bacteroidales bacterium]